VEPWTAHRTLAEAVTWAAAAGARLVLSVAQDEYTHDVVFAHQGGSTGSAGRGGGAPLDVVWLVYDAT
jgi:hypothetical protein